MVKKLQFLAVVGVGVVAGLTLFSPSKAAASCTNQSAWGIHSGSSSSDAGLIIHTQYANASPTNVTVTLSDVSGGGSDSIWYAPNGTNTSHSSGHAFNTGETINCGGSSGQTNGYAVLGYGTAASQGDNYALDCHKNHGTVSGTATFQISLPIPPGGQSGGSWSGSGVGMANSTTSGGFNVSNGFTTTLTFTWNDPAPPANGTIQGRVFIDNNGNGVYDSGEQYVQNGINCGSSYATLGANVIISGVGTTQPNKCNPDPAYAMTVSAGTYNVSVGPPGGYNATTGAQNVTVSSGGVGNAWFGIKQPVSTGPCTASLSGPSSVNTGQNFTLSWNGSTYQQGSALATVQSGPAGSNFWGGSNMSIPGSLTGSESVAGTWTYKIRETGTNATNCNATWTVTVNQAQVPGGEIHGYRKTYVSGTVGDPAAGNPPWRAPIRRDGSIYASNDVSNTAHYDFDSFVGAHDTPAGFHTVNADPDPSGNWTVYGYNLCINNPPGSPGCQAVTPQNITTGSSVSFNLPSGGEVYLRWVYQPTPQPACNITLNSNNGNPTVGQNFTLSWTGSNFQPNTATATITSSPSPGGASNFFNASGLPAPGSLTGSESRSGSWTYLIYATGLDNNTCSNTLTLTINPPPCTIGLFAQGSSGPITVDENQSPGGVVMTWNNNGGANTTTLALQMATGSPKSSSAWAGSLPPGDNTTGQLIHETADGDYWYQMTCTGPGGNNTSIVKVTVINSSPPAPTAGPYLNTALGDIQAGGSLLTGGTCAPSSLTGQVSGQPTKSQAQYVLSAGGNINNFGSANGTNKLTLGAPGNYDYICRPNLASAAAKVALSLPAGSTTIGAAQGTSAANAYTLPANANQDSVFYAPGPNRDLYINGNSAINSRYTLYVEGNVHIKTSIKYSLLGTFTRISLPGFGLIATGNIYIDPSVTQLDGYYFAGDGAAGHGSIDTCEGQNIQTAGGASACTNQLIVNGLFTAANFLFKRTTNPNTAPAEQANFLGSLYVATPPIFSDYILPRVQRPQFQGDLPPLL